MAVAPRKSGSGTRAVAGMPGWVKIFAAVGVVLVIAVGVMLATGHGPGQHMAGAQTPTPPATTPHVAPAH